MAVRKQLPRSPYGIVVPTDFSSGSARAMTFALALAGYGGRVTTVHAVDPLPYKFGPRESSNLRREEAWAATQESMARWLQKGRFSDVGNTIIEGEAALAIAEFAAAKGADLVVLGTSARRHAERLLLGSVAEEIFRESKCPVVVLGPKVRPLKTWKVVRLVFATDLEPHSLAALPKLSNISNRFPADVLVIRAIHPDIKSRSERNRIRTATRQKFEAAADSNLQKHIKKIHVRFAPRVKAIINFAHRNKANAIVMGIRSGGNLSRATTHIPWTLAHRVIAEAKCPVITIRG
jgi:nucleotide-binding universal stress UspA family protein